MSQPEKIHHDTLPISTRYADLIFKDRPAHNGDLFDLKHPKMSQLNRAKIFAPFAALVGFDDRVNRKKTIYLSKHELDADEEWDLNHKLSELHLLTSNISLARANKVCVTVEYYEVCSDKENNAYMVKGVYKTVTGMVIRVDPDKQQLIIESDRIERRIAFGDIYRISAEKK